MYDCFKAVSVFAVDVPFFVRLPHSDGVHGAPPQDGVFVAPSSILGPPPNILRHLPPTHNHVKELFGGLVASRPAVGHGDGVHCAPPQDGVLVPAERVNQWVRLLQPTVHGQRDTDGQTSENLLVLRLLSVLQHTQTDYINNTSGRM